MEGLERDTLTALQTPPYAGLMDLHVPPERVPIQTDSDGVIHVGGTRVTLDTVVAAFDAGATVEEIAQQYASVTLADIYSVIAYYLRHQLEVRAYLAERHQQAAQIRVENERRFDPAGVRGRLLARSGFSKRDGTTIECAHDGPRHDRPDEAPGPVD